MDRYHQVIGMRSIEEFVDACHYFVVIGHPEDLTVLVKLIEAHLLPVYEIGSRSVTKGRLAGQDDRARLGKDRLHRDVVIRCIEVVESLVVNVVGPRRHDLELVVEDIHAEILLEKGIAQTVVAEAEDHVVAVAELDGAVVLERHAWQVDLPVDVLAVLLDHEDEAVVAVVDIGTAYAQDMLARVDRHHVAHEAHVVRHVYHPFLGEHGLTKDKQER